MNIYIYDNSFICLINLIKYLIKNNIKPYNIKDNSYNPNLFENTITLKKDESDITDFINLIGKINFKIIYQVFLSNENNKEIIIYYYSLNAIKYKDKTIYMRNLNCVTKLLKIYNYVKRETHKFKGFTRFKELKNNILYAEINPTNNILDNLSKHFKERLKKEYWIIKDVNRNIISLYNKVDYIIIEGSEINLSLETSLNEYKIKELWKNFYNTTFIKERINERCRINFMPKKYWKYIVEVEDEKNN